MTDIGVVIGTFGDRDIWKPLAMRALDSVDRQSLAPNDTVWCHDVTLQWARNSAAEVLHEDCKWLIFLDADDELDGNYVLEMDKAIMEVDRPAILRPSTLGVYPDGSEDDEPVMIPARDMMRANCAVIGSACPRHLFTSLGGFRDFPILEDWDLWRRMVRAGAVVRDVPGAIYRVSVMEGSRNTDQDLHNRVYREIVKNV